MFYTRKERKTKEVSEAVHSEVFCEKGVFRSFAKFTGKHLCQSLFLIISRPQPVTLLKTRLWHRCFPVNFAKFQRTRFPTEHLRWLLLNCIRFVKCMYNYCIYLYLYAYKRTYFLLLKPRNSVLSYFFLVWFLHIGYVFWKARNHPELEVWIWKQHIQLSLVPFLSDCNYLSSP